MQIIKIFLLSIPFVISYFFSITQFESNKKINSASADSISALRIAVVGDLMCHSPQFQYAMITKDSFDFNPVYRYIKSYLEDADLTLGNLETVIGKKGSTYSGYPRFKSPQEYISALAQNGFDFLCFANNHTLDQGERGVLTTIESLKQNNLGYTGAFTSDDDRDSVRIFNINGIKIALLTYSYGTNGSLIPKGKNYLINLIDYDLIQKDILKAREKNAEIVLVNFHFGNEYQRFP
ncbi:CapA family protein, partial [Ignavibacterium sp.]|uniref:CapA family protein n=1 Tax=Ignavibacterium sp. TaxID=2651167 RepID=UPI0025C67D03